MTAFSKCCSRIAVVVASLSACSPLADSYSDGELVFLRSGGADMPVWVRGDLDADTFVLYLHGGPGTSAIAGFAGAPALLALRPDFGLVFWDQRASGVSQGNPADSTITLDHFVQDVDEVVELVRQVYTPRRVVLMGHSWGGLLGSAYLLSAEHQAKIDGWIEVDGAHNLAHQFELSRKWMTRRIKQLIDQKDEHADWNVALQFYQDLEALDASTAKRHYDYCELAGAYWFDPANEPQVTADDVLRSPLSFGLVINLERTPSLIGLTYGSEFNLSPRLNEIEIPTLLLWGAEDGVVPQGMADDAFEALGTPASRKRKVVFERAAHSPMFEAPEAFEAEVRAFLDDLP